MVKRKPPKHETPEARDLRERAHRELKRGKSPDAKRIEAKLAAWHCEGQETLWPTEALRSVDTDPNSEVNGS